MRALRFPFIVAVVLLALLVLNTLVARDYSERNLEIFTEMVYSKAAESLSPYPELPGGHTQQPLVEGVVVRGKLPFPYGSGEEEALRAAAELHSPVSADDQEALERGARLYAIYCISCHDVNGEGRGPVVLRGMIPPASLLADRARQMKDGQVFHVLTRGQGNMSSYAAQIEPQDRWKVIAHVRALQGAGQ